MDPIRKETTLSSGGISDLVRTLLLKRGITEGEDITAFLNPDYETLHDPFLMAGMEAATARVLSAVEINEHIAIYADFDCDGIPGAVLLSDFFRRIGHTNIEVYIPHRDREGYGVHIEALETLAAQGVTLVITVDVGTAAVKQIARAKELGMDVIVTDHHEIVGELPPAVAVLNPKCPSTSSTRSPHASSEQAAYPFRDLCGSGVAFKLVQAVLQKGREAGLTAFTARTPGFEKWFLDMVAIATVADMVPLIGENRTLVHFGLKVLRKSPRPGIRALCNLSRLRQAEITEETIGFSIAPRINAASRMDNPELAFRLLTTSDPNEADMLAAELESLNASRKIAVGVLVREAKKRAQARAKNERIVVLGSPAWKPALLGLAASSIVNDRGGVVCLWGRDAHGNLKGSCRSDGSLSVADLFAASDGAFQESGGHSGAGGFTVSHERVHTLEDVLRTAAESAAAVPSPKQTTDATLTISDISLPFLNDISRLAPFGVGNPKPMFRTSKVLITGVRTFGKEGNHIECALECRTSGTVARAFDFFAKPDDFTLPPKVGCEAVIVGSLERDSYRRSVTLRIVDIVPAA